MPRPKILRHIHFRHNGYYFKPRGVPMRHLEEVEIFVDEIEALRLHFVEDLNQSSSAKKMNVSQPTFARIIDAACKKITTALVEGKALKINKE